MREAADYQHQLNALLPPGALWDGLRADPNAQALLGALAEEFARLDARGDVLVAETDPRSTLELLEEWEAWTGLPDACIEEIDWTLQERRSALLARLSGRTGQSVGYLIERAAELGHDVSIREIRPSLAGALVAGDELSAAHEDRHWIEVTVPVDNTFQFVAGVSVAGDELGYWRPRRLECLFAQIKPAHLGIIWIYDTGEE